MYPQTELAWNTWTFNTQLYADINIMRNIYANCQAHRKLELIKYHIAYVLKLPIWTLKQNVLVLMRRKCNIAIIRIQSTGNIFLTAVFLMKWRGVLTINYL